MFYYEHNILNVVYIKFMSLVTICLRVNCVICYNALPYCYRWTRTVLTLIQCLTARRTKPHWCVIVWPSDLTRSGCATSRSSWRIYRTGTVTQLNGHGLGSHLQFIGFCSEKIYIVYYVKKCCSIILLKHIHLKTKNSSCLIYYNQYSFKRSLVNE